MKDLNRLKMAHAILVNEKEMATHVARDIYCAKHTMSVQNAVDEAINLVDAINEKYDSKILEAEKEVTGAMQELQELQAKMQKNMQGPGPGGKILRVPGCSGLDGCSH